MCEYDGEIKKATNIRLSIVGLKILYFEESKAYMIKLL